MQYYPEKYAKLEIFDLSDPIKRNFSFGEIHGGIFNGGYLAYINCFQNSRRLG